MSPTSSLAAAIISISLGGLGIWSESESYAKLASTEQFKKMQAKVHMLEALALKAASMPFSKKGNKVDEEKSLFGYSKGSGAVTINDLKERHGGASEFVSEHKILAILVCVIAVLVVIILVWYFVFRVPPPPIVVKGKGALTIKVVSAVNLPNLDDTKAKSTDTTDAYVEVKVNGTSKQTKTVTNSLAPAWNEALGPFEMDFDDKKIAATKMKTVEVKVWDNDAFYRDPLVGELKLGSKELILSVLTHQSHHKGEAKPPPFRMERSLDSQTSEHSDKLHPVAKITLEMTYEEHTPAAKKPAAPAAPAKGAKPAGAAAKPAGAAAKPAGHK